MIKRRNNKTRYSTEDINNLLYKIDLFFEENKPNSFQLPVFSSVVYTYGDLAEVSFDILKLRGPEEVTRVGRVSD